MLIPQRVTDFIEEQKELHERRKLLREYKSLEEFVRRSKEITEKFAKKVNETLK